MGDITLFPSTQSALSVYHGHGQTNTESSFNGLYTWAKLYARIFTPHTNALSSNFYTHESSVWQANGGIVTGCYYVVSSRCTPESMWLNAFGKLCVHVISLSVVVLIEAVGHPIFDSSHELDWWHLSQILSSLSVFSYAFVSVYLLCFWNSLWNTKWLWQRLCQMT